MSSSTKNTGSGKIDSRSDFMLRALFAFLLGGMALLSLYPLMNTLAVSFSAGAAAERGSVFLLPKGFNLDSWDHVVRKKPLWTALFNTISVASLGTLASLAFTALFAYPLSQKKFRLRGILMFLVIFTMVFRYPLIPYFLTVRSYGLMNKLPVLVFTHLLVAYNLVIMRTFFQQIPEALTESAAIEGADHVTILVRIIAPLSKPVFATLGLFYAVTYWNLFLHPKLFLQHSETATLQIRLRQLLANAAQTLEDVQMVATNFSESTIQAATIMFATIPILLLYPFLQRYFIKGALVGSVKG